jgi:hypothetical protein
MIHKKIITINDEEREVITNCTKLLFNHMFESTPFPA